MQEAGAEVAEREGSPLPDRVLDSIRTNRVALKGPVTTPVGTGMRSVNVALRVALELYAAVRPCRWYPGVRSRYERVDVTIVRETTENSYTGIEFEHDAPETAELIAFIHRTTRKRVREDSGLSIKSISEGASERIARFAFDYARANGRRKVTAGHKANIMKFSDGLFLETVRRVAAEIPGRRVRGPDHRQPHDAARPTPRGLRRARAPEPLRRHPVRPVRRSRGRSRGSRPVRTSAIASRCSRPRTEARLGTAGPIARTRWP